MKKEIGHWAKVMQVEDGQTNKDKAARQELLAQWSMDPWLYMTGKDIDGRPIIWTTDERDYRIGRGDLRAVQQQQLNVHSARLALLRVQSEQLAQRVNLHLALGGSFQQPEKPETMAAAK